ncbi:G-protein coupled receptor Mth2-like isoform X1 [Formica exsecta]|uniref:G-protein coupled receptor Mth2-like isoform X1 n=1 Tax=Formica exsecta TaxID=72781 RepID=UPI001143E66A|nr:G-protein coupled receptor Mth2-like isoform X1 [Formica exsecta]
MRFDEIDANAIKNYDDEMKTVRDDLHKNFIKDVQYNDIQYEYHIKNNNQRDNDSVQYKHVTDSIKNHVNDNQMLVELRTNSTNVNRKKDSMSQEIYRNLTMERQNDSILYGFHKFSDGDKYNIVPYKICDNITCIRLCCPLGDRLIDDKCISGENKYYFPNVYIHMNDSWQSGNKKLDELFQLIVHDPCEETKRFLFDSDNNSTRYIFFANGSLYLPYYDTFVESTSYCLAVVNRDKFVMTICLETYNKLINKKINESMNNIIDDDILDDVIFICLRIISMLFLLTTFLVYSILPEVRNIHAFMLRRYSGLMFVTYMIDITDNNSLINTMALGYPICITIALIKYFCYLASFFWLNVMSFDMWWTFRGFRSLQSNINQQERKKLIMYSAYAWGGPLILTIICIIMEFVPSVPKNLRPQIGLVRCWFYDDVPLALYLYLPAIICSTGSICLSISTALRIASYERDAARHLRNSENRCYNNNKKWFNMYLKLFIMLFIIIAIDWIISTAWDFWLYDILPVNALLTIYLIETMQDIGFFIIFVCRKTIKRLLLKRFSCQTCNLFRETESVMNASSNTDTTTSGEMLMQKINSCGQTIE